MHIEPSSPAGLIARTVYNKGYFGSIEEKAG